MALKSSGCSGKTVRSTGPGFVISIQGMNLDMFEGEVIHRSTVTCVDLDVEATIVIIDGTTCLKHAVTTATTTTTLTPLPTKDPRPRPPAKPVDDEDDNDNADDGNGEPTSSTATSTQSTSLTTVACTARVIITFAAATTVGDWWLVVLGVGLLVTGGGAIVLIVRCRCRRRTQQPLQVNEVSSTDDQQQRTYVLRSVPRSPRRRGRPESSDSISLFTVDDSEL